MAPISVSAERAVGAPAPEVYGYIADHREHHANFLPPQFSDFQVESGGVGAGTITRFKLTAGGRTRQLRTQVAQHALAARVAEQLTQRLVRDLPPAGQRVVGGLGGTGQGRVRGRFGQQHQRRVLEVHAREVYGASRRPVRGR